MRTKGNMYEDEDDDPGRENARMLNYGNFRGANFDLISTAAGRHWALLALN